jgi:hypothetical protein
MTMWTSPRLHAYRLVAVGVGLVVALGACGGDEMPNDPSPSAPAGAAEASIVSLDALTTEVEAAIADAAVRFDVDAEEIAVAGALRVVWSDGSLGCPQDDMMYTQALVDGYQLTLEVDGRRVDYHGAEGQPPFLCELS